MNSRAIYHPEVRADIALINEKLKKRVKKAIETRLKTEPEKYGVPLRKTLKGYWKMRAGDYRIIFRVSGDEIIIFGIQHRKNVYGAIGKRL
jgi:mRNA interferase RelE/StbE